MDVVDSVAAYVCSVYATAPVAAVCNMDVVAAVATYICSMFTAAAVAAYICIYCMQHE